MVKTEKYFWSNQTICCCFYRCLNAQSVYAKNVMSYGTWIHLHEYAFALSSIGVNCLPTWAIKVIVVLYKIWCTFCACSVQSFPFYRMQNKWNIEFILFFFVTQHQQQSTVTGNSNSIHGRNERANERAKWYHSMFLYTVLRLVICTFNATLNLSEFLFFLSLWLYIGVCSVHFLDYFVCMREW